MVDRWPFAKTKLRVQDILGEVPEDPTIRELSRAEKRVDALLAEAGWSREDWNATAQLAEKALGKPYAPQLRTDRTVEVRADVLAWLLRAYPAGLDAAGLDEVLPALRRAGVPEPDAWVALAYRNAVAAALTLAGTSLPSMAAILEATQGLVAGRK